MRLDMKTRRRASRIGKMGSIRDPSGLKASTACQNQNRTNETPDAVRQKIMVRSFQAKVRDPAC